MRTFSFFIALFVFLSWHCNNRSGEEKKRITEDIDSVNRSLQKTNATVNQSVEELYQQLETQWAGTDKAGSLQQFQSTVSDFYGYMGELKRRFYIACGDSSGTALPASANAEEPVDFTNRFFENDEAALVLLLQLENVQKAFRTINTDPALSAKINQLTTHPGKEFNKGWFYNVPPVAAITMLSKFENDVRTNEQRILKNLLVTANHK